MVLTEHKTSEERCKEDAPIFEVHIVCPVQPNAKPTLCSDVGVPPPVTSYFFPQRR